MLSDVVAATGALRQPSARW